MALPDLLGADELLALDPRLLDGPPLGDAGGLDGLVGGDAGGLELLAAGDLAGLGLLLGRDAGLADLPFGDDAGAFDVLVGADLGDLGLVALPDLLGADELLALDAGLLDGLLLGDAGPLERLLGPDLGLLDRLAALDLQLRGLALGGDAGLLGLRLPRDLLAHDRGALPGPHGLDLALLVEPRALALPVELQGLLLRLQVAGADRHHRALLNVVAGLAAGLDLLDEAGQALGVEAVRGVEELEHGQVEAGDRDRLELEAVRDQHFGRPHAHRGDEVAALLVDLVEGHLGGDGAERAHELAGEEVREPVGVQGAPAEGGRGGGHRLGLLDDPDEELGLDVHPHPVAGDDRLLARPRDRDPHHVEVDRGDLVDDGEDQGPAVDDHRLPAEPGADEGRLLGRAVVEPVEEPGRDHDDHERDDEPENDRSDQSGSHDFSPSFRFASALAGRAR